MSIFYTEPSIIEHAYPNMKETIPPSKLGYHANNKYDEFPPIMADGRTVTASYQPEAVLNDHLIKEIGVGSNWEYRQYLMKNGKEIMKYNCVQAANDVGYVARYADLQSGSSYSTPYTYSSTKSVERPKGYQASDLKDMYVSREQLQSRMIAPEITQAELYKMRTT
jgi:hypothetical protein